MKLTPLFHVIKDPVHGTMQFTATENAWVKPFIDSPHFQRLRHIKQLGLGDYIFPGAVHSRFNHSLGCSYISSQITQKIGLPDADRQIVMIACLLHDIGHGPFSHAFEDVFANRLIRHEDWTPYFLADFNHHLTATQFNLIQEMIMHRTANKNVLADIVSSQLDADRLDYLLRDSHFCGVRYGEFDLAWMLHCLSIIEHEGTQRLGITHKGIGAVEHYLMARRLMTRNIYHSQKKLALENLLIALLTQVAAHLHNHRALKNIKTSRIGQFLIAANQFNHDHHADKQHFLSNHFELYKNLYDYDIFALIQQLTENHSKDAPMAIAKRLHARMLPKIIRLDENKWATATAILNEFKASHKHHYQNWQLTIIQTPHQSYSGEDDPILVINEFNEVKPLSDFSLMINAIADKLEQITFLSIDKMIANDKPILKLINQLQRH